MQFCGMTQEVKKFSTIKKCDKIILIDKGRIIAQGTHEELINSNSSYKNMNELQI